MNSIISFLLLLFSIIIYHEAIVGKNGVRIVCVIPNHVDPNAIPINAPQIIWVFEWYSKYTLL